MLHVQELFIYEAAHQAKHYKPHFKKELLESIMDQIVLEIGYVPSQDLIDSTKQEVKKELGHDTLQELELNALSFIEGACG